jgi:hypothetical protein
MEAIIVLIIFMLWFVWSALDPKLDWNHETGARVLWIYNPFNNYERKSIQLYIDKSKIQK